MPLWKAGATLAALALVGWCVVAVAVLTAKPENGANIGAGLIGLVAVALSVLAESFLIASIDQSSWKALGIAAICAWPLWLGFSATDALDGVGLLVLGLVPIGLLVSSLVILCRGAKNHAVQGRRAGSL